MRRELWWVLESGRRTLVRHRYALTDTTDITPMLAHRTDTTVLTGLCMACLLGRARGTTDIMDRGRIMALDSIRGITIGQALRGRDFMVVGMGPIGMAMVGDFIGNRGDGGRRELRRR